MRRRIIIGFQDILILGGSQNCLMSGNDAIAFIYNKFRILVSLGTAYSLTRSRERDDLMKGMLLRIKRGFELTEKGKLISGSRLTKKSKDR